MDPFLGQIILFAGNFAPRGWAFCEGQLLPINENQALFSILGTTYGGDGRTTFGLPDLRGRAPISQGNGPGLPAYRLGEKGGNYETTLSVSNLPPAQAVLGASDEEGTTSEGIGGVLAVPSDDKNMYSSTATDTLKAGRIAGTANIPFSNQSPFLALNCNFAPRGWAFCEGQLLAIASNTALFSLFGTTYGGDGRTTFGLPDLRGRASVSKGHGPGLAPVNLGEKIGSPTTTLTVSNLPQCQILLGVSDDEASTPEGNGGVLSVPGDDSFIYTSAATGHMKAGSIEGAQNTQFSNQSPYLALNYIVALQGVFPSRS